MKLLNFNGIFNQNRNGKVEITSFSEQFYQITSFSEQFYEMERTEKIGVVELFESQTFDNKIHQN